MSFDLSAESRARAAAIAARYPRPQAALLPVLRIVQEELGWVPPEAEAWAAGLLDLAPVQVREVATFYSLLRRKKPGRHVIQVCRNLSCTLRGAQDLLAHLRDRWDLRPGGTSGDGRFSLLAVECLGCCHESPCVIVDDLEHVGVTREGLDEILGGLP